MKKEEVKKLLKTHHIKWLDFAKWMRGQTCALKDGEIDYYDYDVNRFISYKGNAKNEPITDFD